MSSLWENVDRLISTQRSMETAIHDKLRMLGISNPQTQYYHPKLTKDEIVSLNVRLIKHIISKLLERGIPVEHIEEYFSAGLFALSKAVDSFDPSRKIKFHTYAAKCIENEIFMFLRSEKKHKQALSLNYPLGYDSDGNELSPEDILGSYDETYANIENAELLRDLRRAVREYLNPVEKEVIEHRFELNNKEKLPQKEIAKKFGISRSYVSRIEAKALKKLLRALENNGDLTVRTLVEKYRNAR